MRVYLLILMLVGTVGCTQAPVQYDCQRGSIDSRPTLQETGFSGLVSKSDAAGSTINVVSEQILRPLGLEKVGKNAYDIHLFIRRDVIEPIDKARRFNIGGYHGAIEVDIDNRLSELGIGISIRF